MVSFHTPLSPTRRKEIPEFENSSKKRKWEEPQAEEEVFKKLFKAESTKSIFDTELHLETQLPLEWQRCLDIESGEIHYYNTRTQKRTSKDPRVRPEWPPSPGHMSLDLELNLPCGSSMRTSNHNDDNITKHNSGSSSNNSGNLYLDCSKNTEDSVGLRRCPSWLAFEGDHREMVTAVCKKCHMLVMMYKSSPACPNCKFVHPPDQSPPNLFKQSLSLLY